jgi:branched-chain amino acid transport system substrate-binding protein
MIQTSAARYRTVLISLMAPVLVACTGAPANNNAAPHTGQHISLAALLSKTGAGAVYGVNSANGIDLAVDEINSSGGVAGARLVVIAQDDESDAAKALQEARQHLEAGQVLGLLGPTLSNSAVLVHPYANQMRVPVIATSNTGLHIVPDCMYPKPDPCAWVFRDSLGEAAAIPTNIDAWQAAHHSQTGVLLVATDDKFSADGGQIVMNAAPAKGIRLLQTIEFSKTTSDLTPIAAQAVRLHPDVIFITSLGNIPARLMVAARQQGFTGEFLGGNGFNTAVVSQQAGQAGAGAQSASAWYINSPDPTNARFVKAYRARYQVDPDQFAAQAYSAIYIYAAAAKDAGLRFQDLQQDRDRLRTSLERVDIDTPLGRFRFTTDHDVHQVIWVIAMDGVGGFKLVTSVNPT